jgi:hypothetical protein
LETHGFISFVPLERSRASTPSAALTGIAAGRR